MLTGSLLKHHALAALLGPLAYVGGMLTWHIIGCGIRFYVSCTGDLTVLPLVFLILGSAGLITHVVTATAALAVGGVHRLPAFAAIGLYAVSGSLLMGLWFTLTGSDTSFDYGFFASTLFPFFVGGAGLGLVVWLVLRRGSNSTPHPDARATSALDEPSSARAGERGRYTARSDSAMRGLAGRETT